MDAHDTASILPEPRRTERMSGRCRLREPLQVSVEPSDSRLTAAVERLRGKLREHQHRDSQARPRPRRPDHESAALRLAVRVDQSRVSHADGYVLRIEPTLIEVTGGSAAGCYYGLQTLSQLARPAGATLSCCVIEDFPKLALRGALHDLTRGKAPTLATLKHLVDRLASWKINQLQLYIEHAFVFSFDRDICDADHGITPDEGRELDAYARDRFVTLVPAVATLGHMGRILSLQRYRDLAEVPAEVCWEEMTWPQRARGLTLNCTKPDSRELVRRIWSDVLDAFSSPVVNICGDEPWDLGKGGQSNRPTPEQMTERYIEHLRLTYEICAARGRRCQIWSDVIRHHPQQLPQLPRDMTVLHWGYDDQSDYDGTRAFVERGFETVVCPGTSGWKRILNGMGLAERNILAFARAAERYGAAGLLTTDWGDHGHFNALACSWHAFALGAACAWSTGHVAGSEVGRQCVSFDDCFATEVMSGQPGEPSGDSACVRLLREAARIADRHETWRLLWTSPPMLANEPAPPSHAELEQCLHASRALSAHLDRIDSGAEACATRQINLEELAVAARFQELFAQKMLILGADARDSGISADDWTDRLLHSIDAYERNWRRRNKPSGIDDIKTALQRAARELRDFAHNR